MGFAELEAFKVNEGLQGLQLKPFKNIKRAHSFSKHMCLSLAIIGQLVADI
jgi:hypothetical protein